MEVLLHVICDFTFQKKPPKVRAIQAPVPGLLFQQDVEREILVERCFADFKNLQGLL